MTCILHNYPSRRYAPSVADCGHYSPAPDWARTVTTSVAPPGASRRAPCSPLATESAKPRTRPCTLCTLTGKPYGGLQAYSAYPGLPLLLCWTWSVSHCREIFLQLGRGSLLRQQLHTAAY